MTNTNNFVADHFNTNECAMAQFAQFLRLVVVATIETAHDEVAAIAAAHTAKAGKADKLQTFIVELAAQQLADSSSDYLATREGSYDGSEFAYLGDI